jgi:hypothetical protein
MSAEKSKSKGGILPNAANSHAQTGKKLNCGVCPACKTLKRVLFSFASPENTAKIIKKARLDGTDHRACVAGFLQTNYGNSFTQRALEKMNKPGVAEQKPGEKILRAHAGRNIKEDSNEPAGHRGTGRPLDFQTRSFMESKMGHSFGKVKIHTDSYASKSAKNLNAHAYTKGNDVFFATDKYKPGTTEGKKLLAHELTHVAQNKNSSQNSLSRYQNYNVSSPDDASERYADKVATSVSRGGSVLVKVPSAQSSVKTIHRKSKEDEKDPGLILEQVDKYAAKFPGFTLVTVLLGRNPITDRTVKRNATTLLQGVLGLIPGGKALFNNLNKSGAIDKAFKWVSEQIKAMNITWESIKGLFKKAWDSISLVTFWLYLDENINKIENIFAPTYNKLKNFAIAAGKKILNFIFEGVLKMVGAPVKKFMGILKKAGDTISFIVSDPIKFLKNLLSALGKGFNQFSSNIWKHLKTGLMGWLFGTLAKAGIEMPKTITLASMFGLVMQVLGITKQFIRGKIARVIGKKNLALIEKVWSFISTLISSGISGLWDMIKEYLGNLKDMVLGAIQDWVVTQIVKTGIVKIVSMFNPVGAIITAIQTIYNTIMFFIDRFQQIMDLVNSVVESISSIAKGAIGKAADWIEKTMARTLPVIISFLARLIGLGGISAKIKGIITKLQKKVSKAIDKVIDKVAKKAKKFLRKILPGGKKKKKKKGKPLSPEVQKRWDAGMVDIDALEKWAPTKPENEEKELKASLAKIKAKHRFKTLEHKLEDNKWAIIAGMNPKAKVKDLKVKSPIQQVPWNNEGDVNNWSKLPVKKDFERHHAPAANLIRAIRDFFKPPNTETPNIWSKMRGWNPNNGIAIIMRRDLHYKTRTRRRGGSPIKKEIEKKLENTLKETTDHKSAHDKITRKIGTEVKKDVKNIYKIYKANESNVPRVTQQNVKANLGSIITKNNDEYLSRP